MTEIRSAVSGVKTALEELRASADAPRAGILRLNLREAVSWGCRVGGGGPGAAGVA
jgi:hypothetical protein